ncbi:MAG: UvrD-helicase domain-containing protein [Phascolarctobacterium sp.]|nr:UvrD-helicase domain-containing protein [Phascolarctobacterium sp.]
MESNLLKDKVITVIDKNVAVSAGAGSGKTFSLAKRFVYILLQNNNLDISNIVAVTFTRMAALEMRQRVRDYLREEVIKHPDMQKYLDDFERNQIVTLDSWQGSILRNNPVEAGLDPEFQIVQGEEYVALKDELSRRFLRQEAKKDNQDLSLLLQYFDFDALRNNLDKARTKRQIFNLSDAELLESYAECQTECQQGVAAFLRLARQYIAYIGGELVRKNVLGYEDVAEHCLKLLRENAEVRHNYQRQIKYLMVDEFQDTNDAQRELIYLLCGDCKDEKKNGKELTGEKLFIVGDVQQSIYKFRGAQVSVFDEVQEAIKAKRGERFTRDINYRSTDKILALVNTVFGSELLFGNKFEKLSPCDNLKSGGEREFPLPVFKVLLPADTKNKELKDSLMQYEAMEVAKHIQELHKNGAKYGDIAILLRAMNKVNLLIQELVRFNIPYVCLGGRGFYNKQEIFDILNLFRVLADENLLALVGVLRSPYFGMSDVEINDLFVAANKVQSDKKGEDRNREIFQQFLTCAKLQVLVRLRKAARHLGMSELWDLFYDLLDVRNVLLVQENGEQLLANVEKLRTMAIEYVETNKCSVAEWLGFLDKVMTDSKETEANLPAEGVVKIMTIHKSKGLGFEHVILPFLADNSRGNTSVAFDVDITKGLLGMKLPNMDDARVWDEFKERDKVLDEKEKKRLLYVAITRAKKTLYMSCNFTKLDGIEDKNTFAAWLWCTLHDKEEVPPVGRQRKPRIEWKLKRDIVHVSRESVDRIIGHNSPFVSADMEERASLLPVTETEPQAGTSVAVFTPSMLQSYLHCQRSYFYQYVCGLPPYDEQQGNGKGGVLTPALQGNLIHTALEKYHDDAEKAWEAGIRNQVSGVRDQVSGNGAALENAKTMFLNYINSSLFRQIPEEHEREIGFQLPVDNGIVFRGVIDCLYPKADGTYGVVDYKTGATPDKLNEGYAMQLAIYSRAVGTMKKAIVSSLALHYLQNLQSFVLEDEEKVYNKAIDLAKEISCKNEEDVFLGSEHCQHCPYSYLCPAAGLQQK